MCSTSDTHKHSIYGLDIPYKMMNFLNVAVPLCNDLQNVFLSKTSLGNVTQLSEKQDLSQCSKSCFTSV